MKTWHQLLLSQDRGCSASLTGRMDATLLSVRHSPSSLHQLLHFNYFNHLVHSTVSSLFHLKYFMFHALWTCIQRPILLLPLCKHQFHIHGFPCNSRHTSLTPGAFVMIYHKIDFIFLQSYITTGCQVFL